MFVQVLVEPCVRVSDPCRDHPHSTTGQQLTVTQDIMINRSVDLHVYIWIHIYYIYVYIQICSYRYINHTEGYGLEKECGGIEKGGKVVSHVGDRLPHLFCVYVVHTQSDVLMCVMCGCRLRKWRLIMKQMGAIAKW